jgi:hypothetical protein
MERSAQKSNRREERERVLNGVTYSQSHGSKEEIFWPTNSKVVSFPFKHWVLESLLPVPFLPTFILLTKINPYENFHTM